MNERNATASLKSLVRAQMHFKDNDLDQNGVQDYWTANVAGLYCLQDKTSDKAIAALNDIGVASADTGRYSGEYENDNVKYNSELLLPVGPKTGYWYRVMQSDGQVKPYAQDTDKTGSKVHNLNTFAAVAYPVTYDSTGRHTFIVNEPAVVYRKDTRGRPVLTWPSAKDLSEEWEKLD